MLNHLMPKLRRWKRVLAPSALAAVAAATGFLTISQAKSLLADGNGPPGEVTFTKLLERNDPTLTDAEAQEALNLAESDAKVKLLLGSAAFAADRVMPWVDFNGDSIGAVVVLRLPNSFSGAIELPVVDYSRDTDSYSTANETFRLKAMRIVYVHVDLRAKVVAGFLPDPSGTNFAEEASQN